MLSLTVLIFLVRRKSFIQEINLIRLRWLLLRQEPHPAYLEYLENRRCTAVKESPPVPPVTGPFTGIWMWSLWAGETRPVKKLSFLPAFVQKLPWFTEEMNYVPPKLWPNALWLMKKLMRFGILLWKKSCQEKMVKFVRYKPKTSKRERPVKSPVRGYSLPLVICPTLSPSKVFST